MVPDVKKSIFVKINIIITLMGATVVMLLTYLYLKSNGLIEMMRPYAPPGQALYVLSKATALLVYILMWWQIMLGIFKSLNTKRHIMLGMSLLFLIMAHISLFIGAVSTRQEKLNLDILLPSFSHGYYKTGLSLGVVAFIFILIASTAGIFRQQMHKLWKFGHGLVYLTFVFATIHGLMIGSDMSSRLFYYVVYGAMATLLIAFIYKKLILRHNHC